MRFFTALFFCVTAVASAGELLPPDEGLEGGKNGHWGAKNDSNWIDGRWNEMDTGPFMFYALKTPGGVVAKGLSIKLGDKNEASICYDTANMSVRAVWRGKYLLFDGARYGLINWPKIAGELFMPQTSEPIWPEGKTHFRGLHVNGKRVLMEYDLDGIRVFESPWVESFEGETVVTRLIEIGAIKQPYRSFLAQFPGGKVTILPKHTSSVFATIEKGDDALVISMMGNDGVSLIEEANGRVALRFHEDDRRRFAKVRLWSGKKKDVDRVIGLFPKVEVPEDADDFAKPGSSRWGAPIETHGTIAKEKSPYVVDTISVPYANPHKALMFLSGLDFFENGDAAVCTLHGDVWLVRGINGQLDKVTWQRFATGLFQPMGVKIIGGRVHVMCRDRLVILNDLNGDGEADYYENFNDACKTSTGGHDYSAGLETDAAGNFYHVDPFGLHKISSDGKSYETIADGWRNPVALSVGPNGEFTVSPQEGEWTPASMICEVKRGGFYGYKGPKVTPERPLGYDPPLCYLPRLIDNSTGGQLWVTSDKWGPLNGQLLNLSFGQCSTQLILRETIDGVPQGAIVPLPWRFQSGALRGRFRKQDGQLYVVGTFGWVSTAQRDGCFQRVRYTGAKVNLPVASHVRPNGIGLTFSEPLSRSESEDVGSYSVEQWNYKYSAQYGSSDYSLTNPETAGHDPVTVDSAVLSEDGRSVFLEIPAIKPVMQMRIKYNLNIEGGGRIKNEVDLTINQVPGAEGK